MDNLCETYLMILNYTKISYKIPRGFIAAKTRIEVSLDALLRLFAVCHVSYGSFFHNPASALFFADFSQRRNPLRFGKLRLLCGTFPAQR